MARRNPRRNNAGGILWLSHWQTSFHRPTKSHVQRVSGRIAGARLAKFPRRWSGVGKCPVPEQRWSRVIGRHTSGSQPTRRRSDSTGQSVQHQSRDYFRIANTVPHYWQRRAYGAENPRQRYDPKPSLDRSAIWGRQGFSQSNNATQSPRVRACKKRLLVIVCLMCANKCTYPRQSRYYKRTTWVAEARRKNRMIYYDSVTGRPLFNSGKCHGRNFEGA